MCSEFKITLSIKHLFINFLSSLFSSSGGWTWSDHLPVETNGRYSATCNINTFCLFYVFKSTVALHETAVQQTLNSSFVTDRTQVAAAGLDFSSPTPLSEISFRISSRRTVSLFPFHIIFLFYPSDRYLSYSRATKPGNSAFSPDVKVNFPFEKLLVK